jgi:hypothetical protein
MDNAEACWLLLALFLPFSFVLALSRKTIEQFEFQKCEEQWYGVEGRTTVKRQH